MLSKKENLPHKNAQHPQTLPFEIEQESLRYRVSRDKTYTLMFAGLAVGCPLSSLIFKTHLDPNSIACILGFGVINSGGLLAAIEALKQPERYLETFENANKEVIKKSIAYDINYALTLGKINAQRTLAHIIGELPQHEHKRWIDMLGLGGILPPPIRQTAVLEPSQPQLVENHSVNADSEDIEYLVQDFDYLEIEDKQFIYESKAVFGNKGSGKSSYMAWEAIQFCSQFPNGKLYIGDIHADGDVGSTKWLPYLDTEQLTKKVLAVEPLSIFKIIKALAQLLIDRKKAGCKLGIHPECFPVKFIWDEVMGTLDEFDDNQIEFVVKALEKIQLQGRKYGIEVTLGLHSIKKMKTGFDSSFFQNLTILALGNAITDNTVKYPSNFDIAQLSQDLETTNAVLPVVVDDNGQSFFPKGLACVVRRKDKNPCVKVMPCLTMPTRDEYLEQKQDDSESNFVDGVEAIAFLRQWASEYDADELTDEMIAVKWYEITGKTVTNTEISYLRSLL
jgi:hypothetical protein